MVISEQLINAIVGYLGKQPYGEVFQLINMVNMEVQEQMRPKQEEPKEPEE